MTSSHTMPALELAHQKVRERGEQTRNAILHVLNSVSGPVTTKEVAYSLRQRNVYLDRSYIRTLLNNLVAENKAVSRAETPDERVIRLGGSAARGATTTIYYFRTGSTIPFRVPVRTQAERGELSRPQRAKKYKPITKKTTAKQPKTKTVASSLDALVEQLISQRTAALIKENNELKKQLAQIKALLQK